MEEPSSRSEWCGADRLESHHPPHPHHIRHTYVGGVEWSGAQNALAIVNACVCVCVLCNYGKYIEIYITMGHHLGNRCKSHLVCGESPVHIFCFCRLHLFLSHQALLVPGRLLSDYDDDDDEHHTER